MKTYNEQAKAFVEYHSRIDAGENVRVMASKKWIETLSGGYERVTFWVEPITRDRKFNAYEVYDGAEVCWEIYNNWNREFEAIVEMEDMGDWIAKMSASSHIVIKTYEMYLKDFAEEIATADFEKAYDL
jgi:hypothetical protein